MTDMRTHREKLDLGPAAFSCIYVFTYSSARDRMVSETRGVRMPGYPHGKGIELNAFLKPTSK